jgi:hypothetical protein
MHDTCHLTAHISVTTRSICKTGDNQKILLKYTDRQRCEVKAKGEVRLTTGHEGPEVEYRYSCTLSLTSALDGVGYQRHAPAALPPGKTRYP